MLKQSQFKTRQNNHKIDCKIKHKTDTWMRPILSAIGCTPHNLSGRLTVTEISTPEQLDS